MDINMFTVLKSGDFPSGSLMFQADTENVGILLALKGNPLSIPALKGSVSRGEYDDRS